MAQKCGYRASPGSKGCALWRSMWDQRGSRGGWPWRGPQLQRPTLRRQHAGAATGSTLLAGGDSTISSMSLLSTKVYQTSRPDRPPATGPPAQRSRQPALLTRTPPGPAKPFGLDAATCSGQTPAWAPCWAQQAASPFSRWFIEAERRGGGGSNSSLSTIVGTGTWRSVDRRTASGQAAHVGTAQAPQSGARDSRASSQATAANGHSLPSHCATPWKRMKRPCSQACRLCAEVRDRWAPDSPAAPVRSGPSGPRPATSRGPRPSIQRQHNAIKRSSHGCQALAGVHPGQGVVWARN